MAADGNTTFRPSPLNVAERDYSNAVCSVPGVRQIDATCDILSLAATADRIVELARKAWTNRPTSDVSSRRLSIVPALVAQRLGEVIAEELGLSREAAAVLDAQILRASAMSDSSRDPTIRRNDPATPKSRCQAGSTQTDRNGRQHAREMPRLCPRLRARSAWKRWASARHGATRLTGGGGPDHTRGKRKSLPNCSEARRATQWLLRHRSSGRPSRRLADAVGREEGLCHSMTWANGTRYGRAGPLQRRRTNTQGFAASVAKRRPKAPFAGAHRWRSRTKRQVGSTDASQVPGSTS
jgi:hypothetical protein